MIHLVYPTGPTTSAPWCIGNRLRAAFEAAGHGVALYDWDRPAPDYGRPTLGDVLVGHPCPGGSFSGAFLELAQSWEFCKVALFPWARCDGYGRDMTEWIDSWYPRVDRIVAICGPHWARQIPARWNALAVDMAIDPADYPPLPICPEADRRVLYVGCTVPSKGTAFLEQLIRMMPSVRFGHIGPGTISGAESWGYIPLQSAEGRAIASQYEIIVSTGTNDANPTTILEGVSMGLVAACTEGAGWGPDIAVQLPATHKEAAWALQGLCDQSKLRFHEIYKRQRAALEGYTWKRFTDAVLGVCL